MTPLIDLTSRQFGRLTVLSRAENDSRGRAWWSCRCSCGRETAVLGARLRRGETQSCGCLRADIVRDGAHTTHGRTDSPVYISWTGMLARCRDESRPDWPRYGGRGITVDSRWLRFENFFADMGERPAGRTLDRINNEGNYEPGNCRWATPKEQAGNRRGN